MKCYSLLYLIPAGALLAGMAHLRADWLGAAPARPEPAVVRAADRAPASASWALRQVETPPRASFLRQH